MSTLCDVNLLLALVTDRHSHHVGALHWLGQAPRESAVICRVAQLGLLRLLNNPAVLREEALSANECWKIWRRLLADDRFVFLYEEPEGLDGILQRVTGGRRFNPKLWTDAYLASFALAGGLTLVTFDRGFLSYPGLDCDVLNPAY